MRRERHLRNVCLVFWAWNLIGMSALFVAVLGDRASRLLVAGLVGAPLVGALLYGVLRVLAPRRAALVPTGSPT